MTQQLFDADEKIVPGPALRPKDAATLIIVRRDRDGIRVLMGQRHAKMAFQPNKFVFPGGRIDPCDMRIAAGGALRPEVARRVEAGISPARARGLALAAIRETFEETGVLIGEKTADVPRTRAPAWRRYFAHGVVPRLDRFDLVARAITPPGRTRRFDARFFMVDAGAIAQEVDATHQEELLKPSWLTLAEARALDLMSITRRALEEAEARAVDGGDRPVPFFRFTRGKANMSYL
ncbi:MAG TPA: NUDIX hydrolase [Rhizomicrobium sp.]|nr:NUDIX hydrolase [Rhizomicrobium sp.]